MKFFPMTVESKNIFFNLRVYEENSSTNTSKLEESWRVKLSQNQRQFKCNNFPKRDFDDIVCYLDVFSHLLTGDKIG